MATKKTAKKSGVKSGAAKTTTRVTTVKAVESGSSRTASSLMGGRGSLLRMPVVSASIAEFVGAFLLAVTFLSIQNQPIFLLFGVVGIFMMIGGLSGAHINPAITVGAWVTRRIGWIRAVGYMAAQFLGAMLAVVTMNAFIGQAPDLSPEAAQFGQTAPELFKALKLVEGKEWTVFFAELIGLAILGFAYASVLRPGVKDKLAGALTVGTGAFVAMYFAGTTAAYVSVRAILNPAVAVTLEAIDFTNVWTLAVFFVAPVIGAVVGFFLHDLLQSAKVEQ